LYGVEQEHKEKEMRVVSGEVKHIRPIVEIGELYFKESPYSRTHKFDKNQTTEFIRGAIIKTQYELAVAENDNGEVVGGAVAYLTDYGWCNSIRASMEFYYLKPNYRATNLAQDLLQHIEDWARTMGAVELAVGDIGFNPKGVEAFYTRLGYTDPGVCLRKIL
jgi:GNAT superfamily N-acetyltransferase